MACILSFVLNNSRLCSTEGKLKGAQCSETVKSRVPSIWFVWKIWDFLVARGRKLDTRGHRALLDKVWLVLKDFLAGGGEAETDTILKTEKPLGRGETLGMIKIGHEQKVTNVMAQQDLWVFTCWAEFCRFLECKEIVTGHNNNNKKTGSHLFLVFRKVISLFRSFVISPFSHFAISCFKHALVMQWFPLPRAADSLL